MRVACSTFLLICAAGAWGQTRVDLSNQTKNVDFSTATTTRPTKTGTLLPPTCKAGEVFFKLDAVPGENLFVCPATDIWSQIGGSGTGVTAGSFQTLITDGSTGMTETTVSIGPGVFRSGSVVSEVLSTAVIEAKANSLQAGAQVWVEFDPPSQARIVSTNSMVNQANLDLTNITLGAANASGFTKGRIPISYCQGGFTPDQWSSCKDVRTPFVDQQKLNAGANVQLTNESDGSVTVGAVVGTNPVSYSADAVASCPASWTTLVSKTLSVSDPVVAGDLIKVVGVFQRTGGDAVELGMLFEGAPLAGTVAMASDWYVMESEVLVTAADTITASTVVRRDSDSTTISSVQTASGLTIGSAPSIAFQARNCATSTIRLVKGYVVHFHDSGL